MRGKCLTCNHDGKVYCWHGSDPCHPKFTQGTVRHSDSLLVQGGFGYQYHDVGSLCDTTGDVIMNADRHLELLSDHLKDCLSVAKQDFTWDGALCNTAKVVMEWFDFVQEDDIKDWPGNSKTLNPTVNLWVLMKQVTRARHVITLQAQGCHQRYLGKHQTSGSVAPIPYRV